MQTFTYTVEGVEDSDHYEIVVDDSKIQAVEHTNMHGSRRLNVADRLDQINNVLAEDGLMADIQGRVFSVEIRNQVMGWMHYGSADYIVTDDRSNKLWRDCYILADGFGALPSIKAAERHGWDWSHVRDSSPQAIRQIHDHITKTLARWEREAEEARNEPHRKALAQALSLQLEKADIETLRRVLASL